MNTNRLVSFAVVALVLFAAASITVAGPPNRAEVANDLFVLRTHFLLDPPPEDDGIWRFDPVTGEYEKQRPFFTNDSDTFTHFGYFGIDGLQLAVSGDTLHTQYWPYEFVFDVFSWRMINRLPTPEIEGAFGWAIQGPILSARDVEGTGLHPGTYGIPRCVRQEATYFHHGGVDCTPIDLVDAPEILDDTEPRLLLFSAKSPASLKTAQSIRWFADDPQPVFEAPVLSFDPDRLGFWRGTYSGAVFHPVISDEVLSPTIFLDFNTSFYQGYDRLSTRSLHYQPQQHRLFVVAYSPVFDTYKTFFAVDPVTGDSSMYRPNDDFETSRNPPISITSLATEPLVYEQMLPIVAETPGSNGTFWTTDLWLFNPAETSVNIKFRSLVVPDIEHAIELGAHQSRRIDNILKFMGGGSEGDKRPHDAIYIESSYNWGAQVVASGRMWTHDPQSDGTFGHTVPAVPTPYGYSNHKPHLYMGGEEHWSLLAGRSPSYLTLDLRESGRFRHNLGVVNISDEDLTINLLWGYSDILEMEGALDENNRPPETKASIVVLPHSIAITDIASLFPDHIASGWPPRIAVLGDHPTPIWFSMVDNLTGDATFVPFTNFIHSSPRQWHESYSAESNRRPYRMILPVTAHASGSNGSQWQTDLYGFVGNGLHGEDEPNVAFYPEQMTQQCNGQAASGTLVEDLQGVLGLPPENWLAVEPFPYEVYSPEWAFWRWHTIFPDAVHLFPACSGENNIHGAMGIITGSWFSGFSRTYTTRADGGTYGSMLPLYPPNGWPVQHFAGLELNEQTRINIGFFNGDYDHAMTHKVTLFAENGSLVAQRIFVLDSLASKQLEIHNFFPNTELEPGTYGLTVLPLDQEAVDEDPGFQGHSWAFVSVIDSLTNDPINLW